MPGYEFCVRRVVAQSRVRSRPLLYGEPRKVARLRLARGAKIRAIEGLSENHLAARTTARRRPSHLAATSPPPPNLAAAPSDRPQTRDAAPPGSNTNVPDLAVAGGPPPRRRRPDMCFGVHGIMKRPDLSCTTYPPSWPIVTPRSPIAPTTRETPASTSPDERRPRTPWNGERELRWGPCCRREGPSEAIFPSTDLARPDTTPDARVLCSPELAGTPRTRTRSR
ncbi:hypothetical protein CERZMDRAFT_89498 [Cercospora zeae-maydis SCOH1-5]|uniref:Uncharacterized protein n=1 Tax=Cercospora zeae-maydis SCOH1-5 TaxID=717836 RepID=A0A6A6EYC3_9PEZI|nr:hypothetical protein CERZMDRAFT_89498 [Cercospora zeae-maydis SCOH1-5]